MSHAEFVSTPYAGAHRNPVDSSETSLGVLRRRLFQSLVAEGVIATSDISRLEEAVAGSPTPFDVAICSRALADEETLADFMTAYYSHKRFKADIAIDPALAQSMSAGFLARERIFPLNRTKTSVLIAAADPTESKGLRGCEFAFGLPAVPMIATASEIEALLSMRGANAPDAAEVGDETDGFDDFDRLRDLASAEPAIRLCNRLVAEASKARASDIHIEPEERGFRVRFRVDGALYERESLSTKQGQTAISRFKILSNLDIAERRRPQDGRFSFPVGGRPVDLRISSTPNVHGESVVLRLLQRNDVSFDLEELGFAAEDAQVLHRLSDRPNGILLLTGPTGSGKTTTLYALIQRLAERDVKILTIEDPVEYRIDGVSQTQVNSAIGLNFASALRSFLRHDPDIIMIGEMRDLETAKTAVQAALTGHLVLSTLHTNDAPSAVMRLLDMGVEDYLVASTLVGAVGQRLVRRTCSACGGASGPRDISDPVCTHCGGAGFHGRLAIAEILEVDEALRAAITAEPTAAKLTKVARQSGFKSMREDGDDKIAKGLTTAPEVLKAVAE